MGDSPGDNGRDEEEGGPPSPGAGMGRVRAWKQIGPVTSELEKRGQAILVRMRITDQVLREDLTQGALLRLHAHLSRYELRSDDLMPLWSQCVKSEALDHLRRVKRRRIQDGGDELLKEGSWSHEDDEGSPVERLDAHVDYVRVMQDNAWVEPIRRCVSALPDNQVVALFACLWVNHRELAGRLGLTPDIVRKRRERGSKSIAEAFARWALGRGLRCDLFRDDAIDPLLCLYWDRAPSLDRVRRLLAPLALPGAPP